METKKNQIQRPVYLKWLLSTTRLHIERCKSQLELQTDGLQTLSSYEKPFVLCMLDVAYWWSVLDLLVEWVLNGG
jgi:hypothetical protein